MTWVWVFLGIALTALILLVFYIIWLAHKASDLFSELEMLGTRAEELSEIAGQLALPSGSE